MLVILFFITTSNDSGTRPVHFYHHERPLFVQLKLLQRTYCTLIKHDGRSKPCRACVGVRSLEVNEAKRGPPQQLAAWQSGYGKRLDALGFFESADAGGYTYPSELVRKAIEPSSEEDDTAWDPDRLEDGEDAEDDEAEAVVGGAEEEAREVVIPVVAQSQDPERCVEGS